MNNLPQMLVIGLIVVAVTVLKAIGQASDELTASILTGALTWTGGHALGYSTGKNNATADTEQPKAQP